MTHKEWKIDKINTNNQWWYYFIMFLANSWNVDNLGHRHRVNFIIFVLLLVNNLLLSHSRLFCSILCSCYRLPLLKICCGLIRIVFCIFVMLGCSFLELTDSRLNHFNMRQYYKEPQPFISMLIMGLICYVISSAHLLSWNLISPPHNFAFSALFTQMFID